MLGTGCPVIPSWCSARVLPTTAPEPVLFQMLRGALSPDKRQALCSSPYMHISLIAHNGPLELVLPHFTEEEIVRLAKGDKSRT